MSSAAVRAALTQDGGGGDDAPAPIPPALVFDSSEAVLSPLMTLRLVSALSKAIEALDLVSSLPTPSASTHLTSEQPNSRKNEGAELAAAEAAFASAVAATAAPPQIPDAPTIDNFLFETSRGAAPPVNASVGATGDSGENLGEEEEAEGADGEGGGKGEVEGDGGRGAEGDGGGAAGGASSTLDAVKVATQRLRVQHEHQKARAGCAGDVRSRKYAEKAKGEVVGLKGSLESLAKELLEGVLSGAAASRTGGLGGRGGTNKDETASVGSDAEVEAEVGVGQRSACSFASFAKGCVDAAGELAHQERLLRRDRDSSQSLRSLQTAVAAEVASRQQELAERAARAVLLKAELQQLREQRATASVHLSGSGTVALEAEVREWNVRLRPLREAVEKTQRKLDFEQDAHSTVSVFLKDTTSSTQKATAEWSAAAAADASSYEDVIAKERAEREAAAANLVATAATTEQLSKRKAELDEAAEHDSGAKERARAVAQARFNAAARMQAVVRGILLRKAVLQKGRNVDRSGSGKGGSAGGRASSPTSRPATAVGGTAAP